MQLTLTSTALSDQDVQPYVQAFVQAYCRCEQQDESVKKVAQENINQLLSAMRKARNNVRIGNPFTVKAWVNSSGSIEALLVETPGATSGQFRNTRGKLQPHIGDPTEKVQTLFQDKPADIQCRFDSSGLVLDIQELSDDDSPVARINTIFKNTVMVSFALEKKTPGQSTTDILDSVKSNIDRVATSVGYVRQ